MWIVCAFVLPLLSESICHYSSSILTSARNNKQLTAGGSTYEYDCPPWHYFNEGKCECYKYEGLKQEQEVIKCTASGVMLKYGQCITHETNKGTFIAQCPYFQLTGHNTSESGFIKLPDNISELNDYMCKPMNRKGFLCSECIDDFGPSATSFLYTCSNCTGNRYGVPVYIFIEFIPITIFYLIILVFRINLTSSPMTCFIFYSQLLMNAIIINEASPISEILFQSNYLRIITLTLYGIWNLDFFKYVVPLFLLK